MPQTKNPIADRIIETAAACFIEMGYEKASTAIIAERAQTSKREIYKHFSNKDNLFEQVMGYLCGLVDDGPAPTVVSLRQGMQGVGIAVLRRFLQTETRGILVCAIGASNKFPEILASFWNQGPGQAVIALTQMFDSPLATEAGIAVSNSKSAAHEFILECCGKWVMASLFRQMAPPSENEVQRHIEKIVDDFIVRYRQ